MLEVRRRITSPGSPGRAMLFMIFVWASAATTGVSARRRRSLSPTGAAHRRRSLVARQLQPSLESLFAASPALTAASWLCQPPLPKRRREATSTSLPWCCRSSHSSLATPLSLLARRNAGWAATGSRIHDFPRGGGSQDSAEEDDDADADADGGGEKDAEEEANESEDEEESDEESSDADEEESEDVEEDQDEGEEGAVATKTKAKKKVAEIADGAVAGYDEPLVASPFLNLYVSLGVMFLAKKVNLLSPLMVRIARFAFIAYLVILEAFVLYVRVQAKLVNDRTVIKLTNPLSSVLQSQLSGGSGGEGSGGPANAVMKNLASSFLSSTSTVMEYDLKQANSMQSGLIFNMAINWFLHFKMEQVQPLLIQSTTGLINMVYSPLFQVYVMGRNLERPFPNPNLKKPAASADEPSESGDAPTESESPLLTDESATHLSTEATADEEDEDGQYDEDEESDGGQEDAEAKVEEDPSESVEDSAVDSDPGGASDEAPQPASAGEPASTTATDSVDRTSQSDEPTGNDGDDGDEENDSAE